MNLINVIYRMNRILLSTAELCKARDQSMIDALGEERPRVFLTAIQPTPFPLVASRLPWLSGLIFTTFLQ
jgi:hypothetical protein